MPAWAQGGSLSISGVNTSNNKRPLTPKCMPPTGDEHAKLKTLAPNIKCKKERKT